MFDFVTCYCYMNLCNTSFFIYKLFFVNAVYLVDCIRHLYSVHVFSFFFFMLCDGEEIRDCHQVMSSVFREREHNSNQSWNNRNDLHRHSDPDNGIALHHPTIRGGTNTTPHRQRRLPDGVRRNNNSSLRRHPDRRDTSGHQFRPYRR